MTAKTTTTRLDAGARSLWDTSVGETMHAGIFTSPLEASLADVAAIMADEHVHCVVVMSETSGETPWGVVSDLDLVAGASVREIEEQTAGGTAATPVVMVRPDDTLMRAAQLMTEHAVSHLVVVEPASGLPIGVLSTLDVARAVARRS